LHSRTYPQGGGRRDNSSSAYIDPENSVNLQAAANGSISGIVAAQDGESPVYLLLVDDNKGSSLSSINPGAYAAHLMTLKHGAFGKLTSADALDDPSHKRMGSRGNLRFGEEQSTTATTSSISLPRMSCASYHCNSGYVYASGTGVFSLNATNVKAVLNGMSAKDVSVRQSGFGKYSSSSASVGLRKQSTSSASVAPPHAIFLKAANCLPRPGARCSPTRNSMALACSGRVAIVAVSNSFYAVPACLDTGVINGGDHHTALSVTGATAIILANVPNMDATKILAFGQSSQVHPVIAIEVVTSLDGMPDSSLTTDDMTKFLKPITSLVFLASGRECTTLEIISSPDSLSVSTLGKGAATRLVTTNIKCLPPKHGVCNFASPILAAAPLASTKGGDTSRGTNRGSLTSGQLLALLTVDGLVHIRSPFCLSVPLSSIEVGTRPNDFFSVLSLPSSNSQRDNEKQNVLATSYGGEARIITCREESSQDFADRLLKMSIDAFGTNGFPRLELAEALGATFSATSYVGQDATALKRGLLMQYLEAVLGLADDVGFFMGMGNCTGGNIVSMVVSDEGQGLEVMEPTFGSVQDQPSSVVALDPNTLLSCTALLCLVCFQLDSPNPSNATQANRAAKACSSAMGTVKPKDRSISKASMAVCDLVADRLLRDAAAASFSLLSSSASMSTATRPLQNSMEFVEASLWLLRSCGYHEKALQVLEERMNTPALRNASVGMSSGVSSTAGWSQIKFDSYFATHLGELWSSKDDTCCQLVLRSSATRDLISRNPTLGLSIFTTPHPQNEKEWRNMKPSDDPLDHPNLPYKVVELLKSITPQVGRHEQFLGDRSPLESPGSFAINSGASSTLPLHSGRALAVTYLESAIGIASGRPAQNDDSPFSNTSDDMNERVADMHDELSYLLLEGVISERGDGDDKAEDSPVGSIYRYKLRRLLSWENTKIRSERLLAALPSSFLREHALLLGRLGRHEDAIKIFYLDLGSIELALEYCDVRYERQQAQIEESKHRGEGVLESHNRECSYLPLVRVALNSDSDSDRGLAAAIRVLSLRRNSIDKSAALQLLPKNVPFSAIARPFLIPAVVENQSQVRRLEIAEALLRCKYMRLKQKLTDAQLKSHASLYSVPALQKLHLGDPLHSSKPIKARPVHLASPHFPDVMLVKYFFRRHLVIQAQVTNTAAGQTLADLAFVIAESSDEALLPTMEVPLKTLPPHVTGSAWVVLTASPQRLETCFLTCELRYTVIGDPSAGVNFMNVEANTRGAGKTYVEELQDVEVRHNEFNTM
jgi:hypothetical protein